VDLSAYVELAVRLANAASDGAEETDGTEFDGNIFSLDGLRELLNSVQFPDTRATRGDLDLLRGLRTEFREIFAACAAGNDAEAVGRLNSLLIQHPPHLQIARHDDEPWHLHLTPSGCVADQYAACSVLGLAALLTRLGAGRFGRCAAPSCQRVFIDTSDGGAQRHCRDACASGANVTAFRGRPRAGTGAALPSAAL